MTTTVSLPLWLFVLIVLFAAVTFASHFLFPSVRWFFRRRAEKVVAQLNQRLATPIQPFKLLRRQDTIQRLLYDPEVTQAIVEHARENHQREDVAFEQARRYAREIVPSFSATAYFGIAIRAARWLSNALYRVRLGHHDSEALAGVDRDATVVFVMNHRSNMDYVLVTYLAAERSALSYAVGEWARVWPLSRLIRAMGAYFIRRRSRGALYRKVLARYVRMATRGGVTQAMFPEGGLSLDGALAKPKVGLLKYIVDGADLSERDVVFAPVAINYDRVLEDRVLCKAGAAKTRRFDASVRSVLWSVFRQVWLRITGRFHKFGYAAVSFGAPVSLRIAPALANNPEALAEEIMQRIAAVVPVLPVPFVAQRLLEHGAQSREVLETAFRTFAEERPEVHLHIPREDVSYAVEVGLRALEERGIVSKQADTDGSAYQINPDEVELARFYANSIRHLTNAADAGS